MGLRESQREHTIGLIVAAAANVFGRAGYHGASMEEVARTTGCATATLYGYFASKEELFTRVLEDLFGAYMAGVQAAIADSEGFDGGVHAYFDHFLAFAVPRRDFLRVMHAALRSGSAGPQPAGEQISALRAAYFQLLSPLVERAASQGLVPSGTDTAPLLTLLTSVLHGVSEGWLDGVVQLDSGLAAARSLFLAGFPAAVGALAAGASS